MLTTSRELRSSVIRIGRSAATVVSEVLCLVFATQVSMAQQVLPSVQGRVLQDPSGQPIRKVVVRLTVGNSPGRGEATEGSSAVVEGSAVTSGTGGMVASAATGAVPEGYVTATDAAGQFKLEGVEPGRYLVTISRAGFVEKAKTQQEMTITVEAGQDTTDLVYKMEATGVIVGKIVDAEGDPLAGVPVVATGGENSAARRRGASAGSGLTNDLGEYRIAGLRAGKYTVRAEPGRGLEAAPNPADKGRQRDQAVYVETYYPGTLDERQANPVQVSSGGTATANFGVLSNRAYRVSGMVLGLEQAQMSQLVLTSKGEQTHEGNLGPEGRFWFADVQPGTYHAEVVQVTGFGNGQTPTMRMARIRTPIVVSEGDVVGLTLQVETGGTVSGKLRTEGEERIDWTLINVRLQPVEEAGEATSAMDVMATALGGGAANLNEDGSFELQDVPGGNYQLVVGARTDAFRDYYTKSVLMDGREVADTGFQVSGGATLEVLVSGKGATIDGTVVDNSSRAEPVANAYVMTAPTSGKRQRPDAYQMTRTDEGGRFQMRGVSPGEFVVVALEKTEMDARNPEFLKKYADKAVTVKVQEGEKKTVQVKVVEGQVQ